MANSDIIKIGFDYRASLEQFEKETNGVFDGISNKAGKQKITIQLDAKDDKVIDKIKELQKLKLDKFTFEFGDSGLKEQLQTFDKLENKINEIISLSKGIDLSFNTKNKTEAYNQLKKYADAFKEYYGNEEAMATNAGAKAGYAYYKAYEEALRKGVAQSKLEKVTVDFDVNDSIFSKERIVENRIKEFENFQKYGNADESNLIAEITLLENRLLKFNSAYSQVKANLGNAPITPEITKNIEEYVRLLEIAESRAKDAELFGYPSEDINSDKDLANMYLDFAKEDATAENKKYIESLKQEETQAIATAEAEQKLAEAQNETVSNTSNSNNSQIEELKSDIQEVKTELGDVKDRISSIESNGFENVRDDVEKTKESVKELNSELAEMKSNLSSTPQESNISSGMKDAFPSTEATASVKKVADGFKEVKQKTEKATESAKDYVRTISQVGEWNVDSKVSVVKEKNDGQLETWSYDAKRGKKDIAYDKDGNINYGDPIITTISNYKQLEQTIVKADDKLRDLKKTLKDTKEINPNASTENIEKQIEYQEEYISLLEKTVKTISKSDEYFLNGQQIIDTRKKAATEYDLKQGTKSDIANAKQSAKANEQAIRQEQKLTDELRKQEEQARKTALSYTESASKKLSDAISKYSYGDSSDATAMMKQMNRGLSNFGDLSNIKSDIKNFDSIVDAIITDLKHSHEESLFALNNEIKAEETMQKQKDAFNKSNLNAIDMEIQKREEEAKAFSNSLKAQMESQQQAESQMSKLESTLSKYQAKKDSYDATIARLKDGGWTSDEYLKNVQAVKDAVKKYEDLLSDIKAKGGIASEEDVQKLKEYEGEIKKTISTVTNMSASEKGYNFVSGQKELDKIHKLLEENSRMSSEAKNKIKAYYAEIESGNPSMSLDRIHGEIMKIYNAEVEAGRAGKSMWSIIKSSGLHQIAAQMAGMFGFYDVINLGKQAIEVVTELDSAFTEMRKVSDETTQSLKNYQKTTFDTANDVGTTAMQIQNSTADWQRLGYSLDEASELAKNSNIYKNVGDMDIDEATEHMISSVQAWKSEFNDAVTASEEIMNRYNKIGNEFAISSADIGEAMENSAAALKAGGNDLNESIGLITAGNLIQQDASTTASAMKILSLRIRGAKADLDAMGESTDDLSDSTSKMREELKALTGVDIMKDENTFKSTAEIIQEMGKNWDKLTDVSKAAALEKLAGKNRASTVSGLIENYETIGKVIEAAENSENSALEENEKYLESIEGRTQKLTNQLQELASVSIKDDWIKGIISGLTNLLDLVTKLVDKIGIVPTILSGVGIFKGIKTFSKNLA
nr:MAG TPA: minor tail protein [Caudoviricetes sp.]